MTFKIGDRVEKWSGGHAIGEVRSVYTTKSGEIRYVVEMDDSSGGYQRICSPCELHALAGDTPAPAPTSPRPDYTNARGETSKPMALSEEEKQDRAELCTISINGHVHTLRVGAVISYVDACNMAHRPTDSSATWSILNGDRGPLVPGQFVYARNGLRISVVQTGAA